MPRLAEAERAGMALRLARAGLFALVCTGLALCGHVLAGGPVPGPVYVAGGFGVVLVAGFAALGRERGFAAITGGLLAGQFGLHMLFMAPGSAPASGGNAGGETTAALAGALTCGAGVHQSAGYAVRVVRDAGLGAAGMMSHPAAGPRAGAVMVLGLSGWMVLAHVLAACVTGWYLSFGESRLWALIRLARHGVSRSAMLRWLISCRESVVPEPPFRPAAPVRPGRVRARVWLVSRVVSWRGPPYVVAF